LSILWRPDESRSRREAGSRFGKALGARSHTSASDRSTRIEIRGGRRVEACGSCRQTVRSE